MIDMGLRIFNFQFNGYIEIILDTKVQESVNLTFAVPFPCKQLIFAVSLY